MQTHSKSIAAIVVIAVVLLIDQALKIWVKTNMTIEQVITITDWCKIRFVENNGMAFGIEVGGKLFLSLFRIVAVFFIGHYLWKIVRQNLSTGYVVCIALIMAGALGNIIDGVFYGAIFSESTYYQVATFVPVGEGYAGWLHGKVVDMFYCPLFSGTYPDWLPMVGGDSFVFFSPIFNVADAAISVGVACILLCYMRTLSSTLNDEK